MVPIPSNTTALNVWGVPLLTLLTSTLTAPPPLWPIGMPSVLPPNCNLVILLRVFRTPTGSQSNRTLLSVRPMALSDGFSTRSFSWHQRPFLWEIQEPVGKQKTPYHRWRYCLPLRE